MKTPGILAALTLATIAYAVGAVDKQPDDPNRTFVRGPSASRIELEGAATYEHGFPIPAGARRNDRLGGATSVAPGKNYTLVVYDVESSIESVTAFYGTRLAGAKQSSEGREVRFSTQRGTVKLARFDKGTRITLVIGPH
jgi:hypothetical protein